MPNRDLWQYQQTLPLVTVFVSVCCSHRNRFYRKKGRHNIPYKKRCADPIARSRKLRFPNAVITDSVHSKKTDGEMLKEQTHNEAELQKAIVRNDTVLQLHEKL